MTPMAVVSCKSEENPNPILKWGQKVLEVIWFRHNWRDCLSVRHDSGEVAGRSRAPRLPSWLPLGSGPARHSPFGSLNPAKIMDAPAGDAGQPVEIELGFGIF
jgi:hypothetical protein